MKIAKRSARKKQPPAAKLRKENIDLRARLAEAEETLRAIRSGEADALVVSTERGDQVFALTTAEHPYRVLIEEMTEGAATLNADGLILYCNCAFADMLKKPIENVIGSKMEECVAPVDRRFFQALLKNDKVDKRRGEVWLSANDGEFFPAHLSINNLQLEGTPKLFCLIAVDLTEQKRNQTMVASEKLARSILDNAAEAIVVCNDQQSIIRANDAAHELCGDNPIGKSFDHAFPLRTVAGEPLSVSTEFCADKKQGIEARFERDGEIFDLLISIGPLQSKKEEQLGCVITLTDITRRKLAEAQLEASKQQYATTLASIGDAVIATDTAGNITFMNPIAEQVTGWSFAEARQKPATTILNIINEKTKAKVESPITKVLERGAVVGLANHTLLIRRDGTLLPIDDSGAPIRDQTGAITGVVIVFRDITARKRMEAEIEALSRFPTENPNPVLRINYNGVVLFANAASDYLLRHWNCSVGQVIPEPEHKLILQTLKTRTAVEQEVDYGESIYSLIFAPVVDGNYVNIYGRDITARKRVEQELQQQYEQLLTARAEAENQHQRLQSLMDALPVGAALTDIHGGNLASNQAFEELWGKNRPVIKSIQDYTQYKAWWSESGKPVAPEQWGSIHAVQKGEPVSNQLIDIETFDGKKRSIINSAAPVRDAAGNIVGSAVAVQDITPLRQAEQSFTKVFHASPTAICITRGESGRITDVNTSFLQLFGLPRDEVIGRTFDELNVFSYADERTLLQRQIAAKRPIRNHEIAIQTQANNTRRVLLSTENIEIENQPHTLTILYDITERKRHEIELERLNRTRTAHTHSAQALIHATSETEYASQICKIIVEDCGHAMVWVGLAEQDENKTVRPIAYAGFEQGYIETLRVTWADTERGRGPTGTAIRTGRPAACRNMLTDPKFAPWREEALRRGYASSLVLPLTDEGNVFGALTIYFREPNPFSSEEVELLSRLADDLAFGIRTIRLRNAHAQAEAALRASEEKARNLIKYAPVGIYEIDFFGRKLASVNQVMCEWAGYSREELLALNPLELLDEQDRARFQERIAKKLRGEALSESVEYTVLTKDRRELILEVYVGEVKYQAGVPQNVLVVAHNITERKRMEDHLRQLSYAVESSPASIVITDTTGAIGYVNPKFCQVTGYTLEEVRGKNPRILQSGQTPKHVYEELWQTLGAGQEWHGEFQNKKKNGELFWELASIAPMIDSAGKITHYVAVKEDITKLKLMEMQLRAHSRRVSALADLSERFSQAGLSVQSILDVVTERLYETIGNASFIALLSEEGQWLAPRSIYAPKLPVQEKTLLLSLSLSIQRDLVRQAVEGQVYTFKDLSREKIQAIVAPEHQSFMDRYIGADVVIAPMHVRGRTVGILGFVRLQGERASIADEPAFLQDVVDRAAIALVNAQLFDQVQRARAELEQRVLERTQSEHQQRELAETMRDASTAFSRTLNLNTVFRELMTWLGHIVSFDSAAIMLLEENSQVRIHATVGYPEGADPILDANRFELSSMPLLQTMVETKTSRCIADVRQEAEWQPMPHAEHIVNWLGVPMVANDQVIGMFSVHRSAPGYFTEDHVKLTETLASYAAAAIQNAQLYLQVAQAREQMETLSRELMEAEENERRAVARELHDEIGQVLTAVKTNLEVHRLTSTSDSQDRSLEESVTIIDHALEQVRSLSLELRPSLLDEFGLVPALEWFLDRQAEHNRFEVSFAANPPELQPSPKIATVCFRVVQAALTNVVRHARAAHVTVTVDQCPSTHPENDPCDWIELSIRDDGVGFDVQAATERALRGESMGLLGMQERVRLAGGQFKIHSTLGHGTEIHVRLPMEKEAV